MILQQNQTQPEFMETVYTVKKVLSIIILIPYLFLFFIYGFKASLQSLNHKFTFQLCLSSIFYSASFLINKTQINNENTHLPFHCYVQGLMSIFGETCCILFTLAIAVITLITYKYSHIIHNNQKLITGINIFVWVSSVIFTAICTNFIQPDLTFFCWFRSGSALEIIYYIYLGLAFIGNMIILTYVKILIKRDLTEEKELEKYPQYVKKINIQIGAQVGTYALFLIWLIIALILQNAKDYNQTYVKVFYWIAEMGECITGILIPLAYGVNKEILDYLIMLFTCNRKGNQNEKNARISELHISLDHTEDAKKIALVDASNIRNLSQFEEADDDL